jgi:hypothetical protein
VNIPNERKFLLIVEANPVGMTWCEIEWDEFEACLRHPKEYDFQTFNGRFMTVLVAIWNKCATKEQALKTASSFVFGTYKKVHLDPEDGVTYFETGIPLLHSPH